MSTLLDPPPDPERRFACQAADDTALRAARMAAALRPPYWPFAPRTAAQERIHHPAARRAHGPAMSAPLGIDPQRDHLLTQLNTARIARAEAGAEFVVALVYAVLTVIALVHFAPEEQVGCPSLEVCVLIVPLARHRGLRPQAKPRPRPPLLRRAWLRARRWLLWRRHCAVMAQLATLRDNIAADQCAIDEGTLLRIELRDKLLAIDLELADAPATTRP